MQVQRDVQRDSRAVPFRLQDDYQQLQIALVGCGGNGSHMAPAIARVGRLLRQQGQKVHLVFIDPDYVEAGNIPRQNFAEAEIGLNKAQSLAFRESARWGGKIRAIPALFEERQLTYHNNLTIVVGCVDKTQGRADMSGLLRLNAERRTPSVWWLDLGNGLDTGQVILGSATSVGHLEHAFYLNNVCTAAPCASLVHPELINEPAAKVRPKQTTEPQSCAQLALTNEQMPVVNQMTAAIGAAMLTKLLITRDLQYWASYFDLSTGVQKSHMNTRQAIEDVLVRSNPRALA